MKKPGNILVITYWPLTNALISTYTLPYLRIIKRYLPADSRIWLFTLSTPRERTGAAFQAVQQALGREGITSVDHAYHPFGIRMALGFTGIIVKLCALVFSKRITHVHAWCTPGGALGWLLSVATGRPLVVDSFEPHAETMVETGNWKKNGLPFKLLMRLEGLQLRRASALICAAPGMMAYAYRTYGIRRDEKFVKPACVDLEAFRPPSKKERSILENVAVDDILCVYAGKFGGIYLEKETFDFFAAAVKHWPGKFRVLLLTSHSSEEIFDYCSASGIDPDIVIRRFVPHSEVARYLAMADFAICPVKPIPTKKYCSPIKNGEYWATGLPVVITTNISIDSDLIKQHKAGAVLSELNAEGYNKAVTEISRLLQDPDTTSRIRQLAVEYRSFSLAEGVYRAIYG